MISLNYKIYTNIGEELSEEILNKGGKNEYLEV